jgi:hypothetical protein
MQEWPTMLSVLGGCSGSKSDVLLQKLWQVTIAPYHMAGHQENQEKTYYH